VKECVDTLYAYSASGSILFQEVSAAGSGNLSVIGVWMANRVWYG